MPPDGERSYYVLHIVIVIECFFSLSTKRKECFFSDIVRAIICLNNTRAQRNYSHKTIEAIITEYDHQIVHI